MYFSEELRLSELAVAVLVEVRHHGSKTSRNLLTGDFTIAVAIHCRKGGFGSSDQQVQKQPRHECATGATECRLGAQTAR